MLGRAVPPGRAPDISPPGKGVEWVPYSVANRSAGSFARTDRSTTTTPAQVSGEGVNPDDLTGVDPAEGSCGLITLSTLGGVLAGRSGRGDTGCSPGREAHFAPLEAEPVPAVLQSVLPSG